MNPQIVDHSRHKTHNHNLLLNNTLQQKPFFLTFLRDTLSGPVSEGLFCGSQIPLDPFPAFPVKSAAC